MIKFAYISDNKIALIMEANSLEELLPLDKKWSNIIDLSDYTPTPDYGWVFVDNKFSNPNTNEEAGAAKNTKITKLALLNRFTISELTVYETALASSVALKVLDKKLFAASFIDLEREDTILGIQTLASAGIITSARATEILTAIPTDIELYRG